MTPIDTVKIFYNAIARGDVPSVLAILHPQLEWTEAEGFPYYDGIGEHRKPFSKIY